MFGLFSSRSRREPSEESDLLVAADELGSMRGVVEELEGRGYEVGAFSRDDLDSEREELGGVDYGELEDVPMAVRSKRGFFPDENGERRQAFHELSGLESHVDAITGIESSTIMNHKGGDKLDMERSGIETVERYHGKEDIEEARSQGEWIVRKCPEGSGGEGVEVFAPGTEMEFRPDCIYEQCVNHWTEDSPWEERRAYGVQVSGENGFTSKVTGVVERQLDSGEWKPKNLSGDGRGEVPDEVMQSEIETMYDVLDATGDSIVGVDYFVNQETGEVKVIERNSCPGWKHSNKTLDYDLEHEIADVLEQRIRDEEEGYEGRTVSEELEPYTEDVEEGSVEMDGLPATTYPAEAGSSPA